MALFGSTSEIEDHGHGLAQEFEDFVSSHAARVSDRASVVASRLATLEAEHHTLGLLGDKIAGLKS